MIADLDINIHINNPKSTIRNPKLTIMSESHDLGKIGEELATDHLNKAGYKILFRNWKWGRHEIDIIAENKEYVVFAEVKTRTDDYQMHPVTAVTREKQKSIILAADGYIKRYNNKKESRFDVITVIKKGDQFEIDHIEDAFYPTLR
jgi:putative endonuclease